MRRAGIVRDAVPTPLFWEPWGAFFSKAHPLAACGAFPGSEIVATELTELGRPTTALEERPRVASRIVVLATGGVASLATMRERLPLVNSPELREVKPEVVAAIGGLKTE